MDEDEVLIYDSWLDALEDLIEGTGLPGADRRRALERLRPGQETGAHDSVGAEDQLGAADG